MPAFARGVYFRRLVNCWCVQARHFTSAVFPFRCGSIEEGLDADLLVLAVEQHGKSFCFDSHSISQGFVRAERTVAFPILRA